MTIDYRYYYLPYHTIKRQKFYSIGHGGFIKAANVYLINKNYLCVNELKVETKNKSIPVYGDKDPLVIIRRLSPRTKITIDGIGELREDDPTEGYETFYHIKGTKEEYIKNLDLKTKVIQNLKSCNKTPHVYVKTNNVYDINGQKEKTKNALLASGTVIPVKKLIYIWILSEKNGIVLSN
ncbi:MULTISPECIES: hypothetical protein [Lactobacillus]|uniref:Uncharacterized protein n=1 Tax=Lactobacillus xujianguonis TaxID=2495899 RepID=A0A437SX37_9LACO|nr:MULTISPECIES: hypothetical protein [Lactobacillus]RVU71479.1 hypothetical protein EJK17_01900 [Lactobacillus xujianguonis]RVU73702.1 hypothetical protein EJK20_06950 [Lactobacillus xujianguonis]